MGNRSALDRRRFLVVLGGATAYAALRPHAAWAKKLERPAVHLQTWSLPGEAPGQPTELASALVAAAVMAPSHWNTQPWRMVVESGAIELHADDSRALPACDPGQVSLTMSLGCALENLLIAARAYGLQSKVDYYPNGDGKNPVARVTWTNGGQRRDRQLFTAIPERRTNRREFDGRGIFMQNRAALIAQIPAELRLYWIDGESSIHGVADLAYEATHAQVLDPRMQAERRAWMRFSESESERRGDGVSVDALELGGPAKWLARRYSNPDSWFIGQGAGSAAKQTREAMRSAGALALLAAPRRGPSVWLAAGQAYERFALKASLLGIAHQPVQAPIEVERFRGELRRQFGAAGDEPLLLVRLGHAKRPKPEVRRAVAVVASFRSA